MCALESNEMLCLSLVRMHSRIRLRQSILLRPLITLCSKPRAIQSNSIRCFIWSTSSTFVRYSRCCIRPKFCSQPGSELYCWGHRSDETKAGVFYARSLIVSQALCAGALSCWKIKNSPEISRMTGSSCSIGITSRQYVPLIYTTMFIVK